jgi:hypothetical protein
MITAKSKIPVVRPTKSSLLLSNMNRCSIAFYFVFDQGDQIGRIFAGWAVVFFRQFLKKKIFDPFGELLLYTVKVMTSFDKNGLGHILGDFLPSTSIWSPCDFNPSELGSK